MVFRFLSACLLGSALLAISACGGGGDSAPPLSASNPSSGATYPSAAVYALLDPGDSSMTMSTFAAMTTVDGLVYRARWRDLEPTENGYNWTSLDAAFDAVRPQNKHLTVHVGASGGAWPAWLTGLGATTYTYTSPQGSSVTDPLPWDTVYLSHYVDFILALHTHIQGRGDATLLNAISVGAPVAEMSLVGCQSGSLGAQYNRNSYLSAWATTIGSFATRFGTAAILISAPRSVICFPDTDGRAFYSAVMANALQTDSRVAVFAADLNAQGSERFAQVESVLAQQLDLSLQTIWSSTNDPNNRMAGTLLSAVCRGLQLGSGYFEIYKGDLSSADSAIVGAIATARTGRGC